MTDIDLKSLLLEELGYANSPGFRPSISWPNERPIPGVDSAFFVQNIPVAYFSRLEDVDSDRLRELHRDVWNQCKVPILYVVLPQEIKVYNGYAEPPRPSEELNHGDRLLQSLEDLTTIESARQRIRSQLYDNKYDRLYLETGAFWNTADGQRIKRKSRADQRLLRAMDQARRHLLAMNISNDVAYALIGRSVFIRYLEDRDVLTSQWVFNWTDGQTDNFRSVLNELSIARVFFRRLSQHFDNNLFPPSEEELLDVTQDHLDLIGRFLDGHDLDSGQLHLPFWPYDFEFIPIELISGIYDAFLYSDKKKKRKKLGAYYTPLSLVDFIVEETLPIETTRPDMTILDPACGSGVFLVRAYQRLVEAWKRQYRSIPNVTQLSDILKHSIFGIDIEPAAVRIAAFSLYLAMLDYLDKEEIRKENFHFPNLEGTNLFQANFFSKEVDNHFYNLKFDRVIGNPPWGRGTLEGDSALYVKEHNLTVGGRQIIQAFLWRAPQFCSKDGEIALLASAKSTILVTLDMHEKFRAEFFEKYHVRAVVNFSTLRYELFESSLSPVTSIFYQPRPPAPEIKLVYGVPKPSPLSQHLGAIVLDATEVKFLDRRELIAHPVLWKVAMWGTPRDEVFIKHMQSFPTLQQEVDRLGWGELHEGFMDEYPGSRREEALWLQDMPLVDTEKFREYIAEAHGVVQDSIFHYPRDQKIYRGPLALIHKSQCKAAYSATDIAYRSSISGISCKIGEENLLRWLVSYINSPLARYYQFLTSSRWAVERDNPLQGEYESMPFFIPEADDPRLGEILGYFDQISTLYKEEDIMFNVENEERIQKYKENIENLVLDLFELAPSERQLVQDIEQYEIDFFYWSTQKERDPNALDIPRSVRRPDIRMLIQYAKTFIETAEALLQYGGQTLNALVYQDSAPLSVVSFELTNLAERKEIGSIEDSKTLRDALRKLDHLLLEQHTPTLYTRRHVQIYDGSLLHLVRPSERRFWTRSQALTDADRFIVELLARSKTEIGAPH